LHYQMDNKRVYEELKALVLNGPGWAYTKRFDRTKNGRNAVAALRAQGEGTAAREMRKQKAYSMIATACYSALLISISAPNFKRISTSSTLPRLLA